MKNRDKRLEDRTSAFPSSVIRSSLDETSAGRAPDDWERVRLGDIVDDTKYGASEAAEEFDEDGPRYVRIKDINDLGRLKESEKASLSRSKAEGHFLEQGDMLFARSGSVGRTYLYNPADGECCHGGYTIRHRLPAGGVNARYLHQFTKSPFYRRWVERISRTGAQPNINAREYGSLLVPLPPLEEQRKIASVLYTVDELVDKSTEILESAGQLKAGLMQDLFPSGRFTTGETDGGLVAGVRGRETDRDDKWSVQPIGNLVREHTRGVWGEEPDGVGVPVLRATNFGPHGIDLSDTAYRNIPESKRSSHQLQQGDIVVEGSGGSADQPVGRVLSFDLDGECYPGNFLYLLRPDRDRVDARYLYYHLDYEYRRGATVPLQSNTTNIRNLQFGAYLRHKIPLPPKRVQREISTILSCVDQVIAKNEAYRNRLKTLKKGLMQDLLSGEMRTHDKDIEVLDAVAAYG